MCMSMNVALQALERVLHAVEEQINEDSNDRKPTGVDAPCVRSHFCVRSQIPLSLSHLLPHTVAHPVAHAVVSSLMPAW